MRLLSEFWRWPLALAAVAAFFVIAASAVACGDDDDDDADGAPADATTAASNATQGSSPTTGGSPAVSPTQGGSVVAPGLEEFLAVEYPEELKDGYALGAADAPVVLTVFEDFQCPFCLRWTLSQEPTLIEEYVVPGHVRFEFRHLPILGDESAYAAVAAECAARENMFWEMHKELFRAQAEAGQLQDEALNVGRFRIEPLQAMAAEVGLDVPAFATCLTSEDTLEAVVEHTREAAALGLRSTPSFRLGDTVLPRGPQSPGELRELLDEALEAAP